MWNDPTPKWRNAQKPHACQGEGCSRTIGRGERYLDKALREPANTHLRYCEACAGAVFDEDSRRLGLGGRTDFPDRYQQRIASADWKRLKSELVVLRGHRCERCGIPKEGLALHHKHYRTMGHEAPDDLELLCTGCHDAADNDRSLQSKPKYSDATGGWIVEATGERWAEFDPQTIYVPLGNDRFAILKSKFAGKKEGP